MGGLVLDRLQRLSPRARAAVYDVVLGVAVLLAVATWGLPVIDVHAIGPVDVDELGKAAIATSGLAALLARANTPATPAGGEHRADAG